MLDIIGLGDADVDLIVRVDHVAGHDEKVRGRLVGKCPGGVIANFCCAAARFGARAGIVTTVGNDEFGRLAIEELKNFGVDTGGVVVKQGEETYFCIVLLDGTGEKALTIVETSTLTPKIEDIDMDYVAKTRYLHMPSLDIDVIEYAAPKAAAMGVKVSIDIEATAACLDIAVWEKILRHTYIVFPNEAGLRALFGEVSVAEAASEILKMGPRIVVVTCGAKGAQVFASREEFSVPAFRVRVEDTTGAGDCFNAVFLSGLCKGWDMRKSAQYASAAAAMSVQAIGARTGLPSEAEVDGFLEKMSGKV